MSDIIDKLSEVTGFKKPEMDTIFQEVKANQALLAACPRHDFSIVLDQRTKQPIENPTSMQRFGARFKCVACGGVVDGPARIWYDLGLKHGKTP